MSAALPHRATFAALLETRAAELGDKPFVTVDGEVVSFAQARRRSTAAANRLLELGVAPGETVGLFAPNCAEWIDVWLGCAGAGIRTVAVNAAYRGEYLRHQLAETHATAVLVDARLLPRLAEVAGSLPELRLVLVRGDGAGGAQRLEGGLTTLPATVLATGDGDALRGGRPYAWRDPACVFYTSGTTGTSKGALLSQHYLATTAAVLNQRYRTTADDVMYAALPLFHMSGAMGVVMGSLLSGRSSVLDSAFHPGTCWERVREVGATQFFAVGPMIMMLYGLPPSADDASLPFHLMIGAPIPADLHRPLEQRYGCTVVVGYGLTEAMLIASHEVDEPVVPGTAGRPGPLYDVRVVDDDDDDVPAGAVGEIAVRPRHPHVMFEGYLDRPQETLERMRNLWFHTGDLGRIDERGMLSFVDRKKDAIRRRGENISSFEVERSILEHPAILECAAHAVPSPLGEDDVKVCVVLRPGAELAPEELFAHAVQRMPSFAVPRYVEVLEELPKNQVGRVQKHVLRERGIGERTWVREESGHALPR